MASFRLRGTCAKEEPVLKSPARDGTVTILKAGAVVALFGGFTPNVFLFCLAVAVLMIGVRLLLRAGEAPILLFIFFFQWLQASVKIFVANALDRPINDLAIHSGDLSLATAISLVAVASLAFGMRLAVGSLPAPCSTGTGAVCQPIHTGWFFRFYLAATFISAVARALAWNVPGLTQPLIAVAYLKWAFFFALTYSAFARGGGKLRYWFPAFLFELAQGFGGFFSEFKTVIFFSILGILASDTRMSKWRSFVLVVLVVLLLSLGVIWTAIKSDYRSFVSGGEQSQIVTVDYAQSMEKLGELVVSIDGAAVTTAAVLLLDRIGYVDYFGGVLSEVPKNMPHEYGALWFDALRRPFMPRLFFGGKTVIDDSERTNLYAGTTVAGTDEGTSIGIGYIAESYIDFGPYIMMVPIFLFGMLLGWIFKWFATAGSVNDIIGSGLGCAVIFWAAQIESSITKMIGGLAVSFLVSWLCVLLLRDKMGRCGRKANLES